MREIKTKQTEADVSEFINSFADTDQKRKDSFELIKIMKDVTWYDPKMRWPTMIWFGSYHYKSERSRQEGDRPMVWFSPRKAAISLYIYSWYLDHFTGKSQDKLLEHFGNFKMGKGCIYVKKLSDINQDILRQLILSTIDFLKSKYKINQM